MFRQYQYDQITQPALSPAPVATPSVAGWGQPSNQPTPGNFMAKAAGYAIALIVASGIFWNTSTQAETVTVDRWGQPQSQPYPARKIFLEALDTSDGQSPAGYVPDGTDPSVWIQQQYQPYPTKPYLSVAQQQASFWNTSTQPENVLVSSWAQPQSQPYPYRKVLLEALDVSDGQSILGSPPDGIDPSVWIQLQSQNYPSKLYLQTANQQALFLSAFTPTVPTGGVQGKSTCLLINKSFASRMQSLFWGVFTPTAAVTPFDWIQPQSQPLQQKKYLTEALESSDGQSSLGEDSSDFFTIPVYPDIVRGKQTLQTAEQQSVFFGKPTDVEYFVDSPLQSQPTASRRTTQPDSINFVQDQGLALVVLPEQQRTKVNQAVYQPCSLWLAQPTTQIFLDWQQQQSQPSFRKVFLEALEVSDGQTPVGAPPEGTNPAVWGAQSQPIAAKKLLTADQQSLAWNTSTSPEVVTEDRWHPILWQPFAVKRYLLAAQQQAFFWGIVSPPDTLFPSHWGPTYPQPFPRKLYLATADIPSTFWNTSTSSETTTEDRWHQPVSQPYPYRSYRPAALYPTAFYDSSFAPESVSVDKWGQPQSQPIPKRYPRASYESVAWTLFTPVSASFDWLTNIQQPATRAAKLTITETTFIPPTAEGWNQQQTQPKAKTYSRAVYEAATSWSTLTPLASIDWLTQTQQPTRVPTRVVVVDAVFVSPTAEGWSQPVIQPVLRQIFAIANQQAFFWSTFTPPSVTTVISPIVPDTVKGRQYLTANQQSLSWSGFTPVVVTVQSVYSDKIVGRQYSVVNQQSFFWGEFTTFSPEVLSWQQQTNQPRQERRTLLTTQQQAAFWNTSTGAETVFVSSWAQPISQPYPYKHNLTTNQQQVSFWNTLTPPPSQLSQFIHGTGTVVVAITTQGTSVPNVASLGSSVTNIAKGTNEPDIKSSGSSETNIKGSGSVM